MLDWNKLSKMGKFLTARELDLPWKCFLGNWVMISIDRRVWLQFCCSPPTKKFWSGMKWLLNSKSRMISPNSWRHQIYFSFHLTTLVVGTYNVLSQAKVICMKVYVNLRIGSSCNAAARSKGLTSDCLPFHCSLKFLTPDSRPIPRSWRERSPC